MIAGLEAVDDGKLLFKDRVIVDTSRGYSMPPHSRDVGMVFQSYAIWPHMTVEDNVGFPLKVRREKKAEVKERVTKALELVGLAGLEKRPAPMLSGGQQQRVALARALIYEPNVLLLDEPFSNLDAKLREQMRLEVKLLQRKTGVTIVFVTHDQVEAMTMGDRLVVMQDGRIQQIGAPVHLYRRPANRFVAGFIGSPSMNFLEGELIQDGGLVFSGDGLRLPILNRYDHRLKGHFGRRVTLGIRPEHIFYASSAHGLREAEDVTAKVEVVEPMGHETYLYLTAGRASCVARMSADRTPSVGEEVHLAFDLSAVHLFDRETGGALLRDASG
jgi:multiple sugar transport system ATP-binding protein